MRTAIEGEIARYDPAKEHTTIFSSNAETQNSNDYFLESGDKIRYFFEPGAIDDQGRIVVPTESAFNKIGHALHSLNPTFRKYTFDPRIVDIAADLGLNEPVVPQSMYIFKQPGIGGEVTSHQDSTFLYTTPLSTTGFWIPLQDCDRENGCLQMVPGSHHQGLLGDRRMVRSTNESGVLGTTFTGQYFAPPPEEFQACETPMGSLVIIHGSVVHRSDPNKSARSRHAYTFHAIESQDTVYASDNWLQYPEDKPFPRLVPESG
ncbi:uncharacterized protein MONBRDRAFT_21059 [Monosiga brevicollis MX1]|uniref:Phytanoyl-CoA dioxygenase n=1 Tax=Monosiga brevicollis TaxID=81824 RepID=A9UQ52_MONBE|nr:uncharacterized protein MONBRDRAFT_21059 [Monosiga brevicollis MX1]EDQ92535.1 predicted protein [Monosiga brevicollis MX1]|eukprot:XP_001742297.1 hypothetical protein [Monosiga brevicollis MX1]